MATMTAPATTRGAQDGFGGTVTTGQIGAAVTRPVIRSRPGGTLLAAAGGAVAVGAGTVGGTLAVAELEPGTRVMVVVVGEAEPTTGEGTLGDWALALGDSPMTGDTAALDAVGTTEAPVHPAASTASESGANRRHVGTRGPFMGAPYDDLAKSAHHRVAASAA
ncbi:MAG: hypothetical protein ACYDAN_00555 [Candidatus Limnocylindrales bacterium]